LLIQFGTRREGDPAGAPTRDHYKDYCPATRAIALKGATPVASGRGAKKIQTTGAFGKQGPSAALKELAAAEASRP
jgi:hypothetical protein